MGDKVEWACPRCKAKAHQHGNGGQEECETPFMGGCEGLICECDDAPKKGHGDTTGDPCPNATCYHCGWAGTFPPLPYKLKGWMKQAWDAGWRPPPGWQPEVKS